MRNKDRRVCQIFSKNLKYYMDLKTINRKELAKGSGVQYSTLCNWLNCYSYAEMEQIEKVADFLEISKYDLIEANEEAKNHVISDKENYNLRKEAINKLSKLSNEELKNFIGTLNLYLKNK